MGDELCNLKNEVSALVRRKFDVMRMENMLRKFDKTNSLYYDAF